jgi:thiosulfate/3-mercaptopyruvate sulfurtransferase
MSLPVLVDTQTLKAYLDLHPSALIIDVCPEEHYLQGHLPGAVNIPPSKLSSGIKPATGSLPDADDLKALLESVGLTPNKQVIIYDDAGGSWAGRLFWTLEVIGHTRNTLLDGGIVAWRAEDLPITTIVPEPKRSTLSALHYEARWIADKEEILASLHKPGFVVWDARAAEEYSGTKAVSARGGHIPGAVNVDWVQLYDAGNHTRLLPLDEIQQRLNAAGITSDKTIVTHCQTHRRSGLAWFVAAKLLAYPNIKAYPGSWAEWGNLEHLPIEK